MSGIGAIQPVTAGDAWQALLQAANEAEAALPVSVAELPQAQAQVHLPGTPAVAALAGVAAAEAPAVVQRPEPAAAVLPLAPALLQPLTLAHGPELRWRVQDGAAWRALFDAAGEGGEEPADTDAEAGQEAPSSAAQDLASPPWAAALLARLQRAAAEPVAAAALRPALQAWRAGLPVLLASPAGLAALRPSRDAALWRWRRWPARWRAARPATDERWWAVRLGLGPQGRPRTLRDLTGAAAWAPGQVSCELRLDDLAPGIAQWTEVLVQAPAQPSLRALLAARPSLPWLLCNQALWPKEDA